MTSPIKLIVGLGNPGSQYEKTRHNAGFWFVEQVARDAGVSFRRESKFHATCVKVLRDAEYWLQKPETFMNRSGQAVAALTRFYRLQPENILVVHDELDLDPGTARLKRGGGHGGHNGLRDIVQHLGSKDFIRLRLGIGHPGNSKQVSDYVLKAASVSDQQAIDQAIDDALRVLPWVMQGELDKAMNRLH